MATASNSSKKDYIALAETAILQLEEQGISPSIAKVREITGGSNRDVLPAYRQAIDRLQERRDRDLKAPAMPAELDEHKLSELWPLAYDCASREFRPLVRVAEGEKEKAQTRVLEIEKLVSEVELEMEDWQLRAEKAENLVAKLERKNSDLRHEFEKAEVRLAERSVFVRALKDSIAVTP